MKKGNISANPIYRFFMPNLITTSILGQLFGLKQIQTLQTLNTIQLKSKKVKLMLQKYSYSGLFLSNQKTAFLHVTHIILN